MNACGHQTWLSHEPTAMTEAEFVRRVHRLGRSQGGPVRLDRHRGEGGSVRSSAPRQQSVRLRSAGRIRRIAVLLALSRELLHFPGACQGGLLDERGDFALALPAVRRHQQTNARDGGSGGLGGLHGASYRLVVVGATLMYIVGSRLIDGHPKQPP